MNNRFKLLVFSIFLSIIIILSILVFGYIIDIDQEEPKLTEPLEAEVEVDHGFENIKPYAEITLIDKGNSEEILIYSERQESIIDIIDEENQTVYLDKTDISEGDIIMVEAEKENRSIVIKEIQIDNNE